MPSCWLPLRPGPRARSSRIRRPSTRIARASPTAAVSWARAASRSKQACSRTGAATAAAIRALTTCRPCCAWASAATWSSAWRATRTPRPGCGTARRGRRGAKTSSRSPSASKYRFAEAADSQRPSMAVIVRLFPRSGSGDYRTSRATGDLRIAADWDFAPQWSLNPNLGVGAYEGDGGRLYTAALFAATLGYNPSKVVNVFVDIGGQYPETASGRGSAVVDGGIAYIAGRDVQLDFSVGARVAGVTAARVFWAAGISKRF
ncbi:MAG: transporter [Pseudomonadota bacterium]